MKKITDPKQSLLLSREWAVQIKEKLPPGNNKIRFPIYMTDQLMNTDIDELELSVRSSNCLHRAGYQKIGQLIESITGSDDLKRIRNCGRKSICEIMTSLLMYQYSVLPPASRPLFIQHVLELSRLSDDIRKERFQDDHETDGRFL